MAGKQLVIVVEGTTAMGTHWNTIVSDYLYNIIRSFCDDDMTIKKPSSSASGSTFELALVMFNAHGPYSAFLVQRSGWTRDVGCFFNWLSTLSFSGGGSNDVATAEGLAEALMAKRSHTIPEPAVDVKQPDFLVLISYNFKEACAALSRSGVPPANESTLNRPPISTGFVAPSTIKVEPGMGNVGAATVKMEPGSETFIGFEHAYPRMPSMPHAATLNNNSVPELNHMAQGIQSVGINNPVSNTPMTQQSSSKSYVKIWQGDLLGLRQGEPVHITKLEGYRNVASSETLAGNWPSTMLIEHLISQDHMQNKALTMHGFLSQLQEKKLCAVIQLPSQVLLLSVSDKVCRLIAMLLPGDMFAFKLLKPSQQQLQHQQLQQQLDEMYQQRQRMQQWELQVQQQIAQLQQQPAQLQSLPQQMAGAGIGQGYSFMDGPSVPQLSLQGQVSYQGISPDMAGGRFMGSFKHQ